MEQFFQNFSTDQIPSADQLANQAVEIFQSITTGVLIIGLILALLGCFFGYRMLKFWISLAGFILGAIAGYAIAGQMTQNSTYIFISAFAGALLISFLSYKIYLIGVFLLAGFGSYFLAVTYLPLEDTLLTIAAICIGIIVAILAVLYMRPAVIVVTGLQNGIIAAGILAQLITIPNQSLVIPLGAGLGMIGASFQFLTTRTRRERRRRKLLKSN